MDLTGRAKDFWEQIPAAKKPEYLSTWCGYCHAEQSLSAVTGTIIHCNLVLRGECPTCGARLARVVEQGPMRRGHRH